MKVQPQTIPTPRGCLVGWKVVTKMRYPVYRRNVRHSKDRYKPGTIHIADNDGRFTFGEYQSAEGLARRRSLRESDECMPGIHLCRTPGTAKRWERQAPVLQLKIIPVAYSPKSIVGKKGDDIVVVYRIKVLG